MIVAHERELYQTRVGGDPDFVRFCQVHNDCFTPSVLLMASREIPGPWNAFHVMVQLAMTAPGSALDLLLCDSCGYFFTDKVEHYAIVCAKYHDDREKLWTFMVNNFSVEMSAWLYSLEDTDLLNAMLGCRPTQELMDTLSPEEYYIFLYRCARFLCKTQSDTL